MASRKGFVCTLIFAILLVSYFFFLNSIIQKTPESSVESTVLNFPFVGKVAASTWIAAVREDNNEGILGKVLVEVRKGDGKILMDTSPFVDLDTQFSANIAVEVIKNLIGVNTSQKDIVVSFEIGDTEVGVLGGPSAGAPIAVATYAALEGKTINKDVVITGTIEPSGKIGQVGSVLEKANAACEKGVKLFLVSEGTKAYKIESIEIFGGFTHQEQVEVDLQKEMQARGMKVKEVRTINDVLEYMIK